MEDKQKKFLDKVVELLVKDTIIDHEYYRIFLHFLSDLPYPTIFLSTDHLPSPPFSIYCKDTYGLSDKEIEYVWDRYRAIIQDKINNKRSINESEDKQKKYLDKVVEFLVKDTIIDHENGIIILDYLAHLFTPTHLPPPLRPPLPLAPLSLFSTYCKDTYGLTRKEINYVWENYRNIIIDKINNKGSINESEDKQNKFLDKVAELLVKDTIIDHENERIILNFLSSPILIFSTYPSPSLSPSHLSLLSNPPFLFSTYCKDTYGLTEEEIDYVWKKYRNIINDKINNSGNINETEDKQRRYLDKVFDYLVEDTIINDWFRVVKFPYAPDQTISYKHGISLLFTYKLSGEIQIQFAMFYKYCKESYGLTDDEIDDMWYKYTHFITKKILDGRKGKSSINESEDKQNRYLGKVVELLVKNTEIDYENKTIKYPFLFPPSCPSRPLFAPLSTYRYFIYFYTYCIDTYGLTDDEVEYVWYEYRKIINNKINSGGSINESDDKQKRYLNKILKWILQDTVYEHSTGRIMGPFYSHSLYSLPSTMEGYFIFYCITTYGITEDEAKQLWVEYRKIIKDTYFL